MGITAKVRVLVVDDSAFFRRRITDILGRNAAIQVVAEAPDGLSAVRQTHKHQPDVITMDVEMPVLDGISAVRRIMSERPTPIIMFSTLTKEGAKATLDALEAGAVDFLPKQFDDLAGRRSGADELVGRVLAVGKRGVTRRLGETIKPNAKPAPAIRPQVGARAIERKAYRLLAIGASTGGPIAIQELLTALPSGFRLPILLVVHMPASFTPAYAERLNSLCNVGVKEAEDGDTLRPGQAYLAPGGKQMVLERSGAESVIRIKDSSSDQTYKPSVDVTLGSAARLYGGSVLAVILTGMGADGKLGAQSLKTGGSTIWSQDEASCVVFGMPQAVEKAGISDRVLALKEIGPSIGKAV
jgi:two-component system chemotaxis response regulator CheB